LCSSEKGQKSSNSHLSKAVVTTYTQYDALEQRLAYQLGWNREELGTCEICGDGSLTSNFHQRCSLWLCRLPSLICKDENKRLKMACAYCWLCSTYPVLASKEFAEEDSIPVQDPRSIPRSTDYKSPYFLLLVSMLKIHDPVV